MMRPLFVFLGLVSAVAAWPAAAVASGMATFQFTNTTGGPVSRADFAILPAGAVKAPIIGTDPNTGLPKTASPVTLDTAHSSGFDTNNFSTALGTGTNVQGLRLLFGQKQVIQNGQITFQPVTGPNGEPPRFLDAGGTVTFALNLDPAFTGTMSLKSLTNGLADPKLVPPGSDGGVDTGTGSPPDMITPEPISLILWSSVAGLGVFGVRRRAAMSAAA
ncbi:MAG: hypothetical protein JWN86_1835 [Planctomycetota bacterium]|nr:hypothetical protein [Planctomycetota bacterium]